MIPFHVPYLSGDENKYIAELISHGQHFSGDGEFSARCTEFLQNLTGSKTFLTPSCTDALEMAAILIDIQPGDEVIMSPFTFPSTANAFELRGAKVVFCDIKLSDLNIDEDLIESAITSRTKAIVPMHYAGVGCNMERINQIAKEYNLFVIEDAAQCINSFYNGRHLGSIGDIGCISFHETKNIHCGEGGAILINNPKLQDRAEIIREKGTNRSQFLRGEVDFYTKVDVGSSYLMSELNAAFLWAQLQKLEEATTTRLDVWNRLKELFDNQNPDGLYAKGHQGHNGHIFWHIGSEIELPSNIAQYSHYELLEPSSGLKNVHLCKELRRVSLNPAILPHL